MKIIVNASIFNAFASRLVATSALYNSLAVQKGLAKEVPASEDILHKIPFFHNIKEQASKIATVTKTEGEVIVEINDNYIIGSINLAFNLYDRVADAAVTMIKEIDIWEKESKIFEAEWSENNSDEVVTDIIKQAEEGDNHFGTTKVSSKGIHLTAGKGKCKTIYAPDIDKQIVINALTIKRDGESIPYELSAVMVSCICQSEADPCFFVGGTFDLPISVINAVRELYDLPLFPTKEEVEANEKEREERRAAEFKAEQEAKKAERKQTKVADHPNGLKEFVKNTLADNKATKNNQDK